MAHPAAAWEREYRLYFLSCAFLKSFYFVLDEEERQQSLLRRRLLLRFSCQDEVKVSIFVSCFTVIWIFDILFGRKQCNDDICWKDDCEGTCSEEGEVAKVRTPSAIKGAGFFCRAFCRGLVQVVQDRYYNMYRMYHMGLHDCTIRGTRVPG